MRRARHPSMQQSMSANTSSASLKSLKSRNTCEISLSFRQRGGEAESAAENQCIEVDDTSGTLRLQPSYRCHNPHRSVTSYHCDNAFGPDAKQEDIFGKVVAPLCHAALEGYNCAVIAYGQTGSGKTHTMIGDLQAEETQGVAPRAISAIFGTLQDRPAAAWWVECTAVEIYNERVRDLLAPPALVSSSSPFLDVRQTSGQGFHCPDATRCLARQPEEAMRVLMESIERREVASTDMNHCSSRSHLLFTMSIVQKVWDAGVVLRSRLHLVDLAGSERLKRTFMANCAGRYPHHRRERETAEINKSLSQLALVIQRLSAAGVPGHIPYRDSVLTRLLADTFGGNSKTSLIITCSSLAANREETRSSLEFGKRAKLVKNSPKVNLEMDCDALLYDHGPATVVAPHSNELVEELVTMEQGRNWLASSRPELQEHHHRSKHSREEALLTSQIDMQQLRAKVAELEREKAEANVLFSGNVHDLERENAQLLEELGKLTSTHLPALQQQVDKLELHNSKLDQQLKSAMADRTQLLAARTKDAVVVASAKSSTAEVAKLEEEVGRLKHEKVWVLWNFLSRCLLKSHEEHPALTGLPIRHTRPQEKQGQPDNDATVLEPKTSSLGETLLQEMRHDIQGMHMQHLLAEMEVAIHRLDAHKNSADEAATSNVVEHLETLPSILADTTDWSATALSSTLERDLGLESNALVEMQAALKPFSLGLDTSHKLSIPSCAASCDGQSTPPTRAGSSLEISSASTPESLHDELQQILSKRRQMSEGLQNAKSGLLNACDGEQAPNA
eukprot:TRINITY_DN41748_c0_g1_i1.p1 TRINITY_DN41748_c0_g1~~TRINITY_DN41748_c0_g1_i1.p1  ORF type:complete len:790 (+),score=161.10 TRINITY_DN41748_c0_g1_i1:104-2473(+)